MPESLFWKLKTSIAWASFIDKDKIIAMIDLKNSFFQILKFTSSNPGSGSRIRGWIRIRARFGIETNADPQHWLEKTLRFNILYGTLRVWIYLKSWEQAGSLTKST